MSIFFDLFSPGQRHRVDEQERLEHTREVEQPSEPGRGPIDLGSGVVLIKSAEPVRKRTEAEGSAEGDEPTEPAADESDA